jgi:hypothetical protein
LIARGDLGIGCAGSLNELLLGLNEVNLGGVLGLAGILVFLLPFSAEPGGLASVWLDEIDVEFVDVLDVLGVFVDALLEKFVDELLTLA